MPAKPQVIVRASDNLAKAQLSGQLPADYVSYCSHVYQYIYIYIYTLAMPIGKLSVYQTIITIQDSDFKYSIQEIQFWIHSKILIYFYQSISP